MKNKSMTHPVDVKNLVKIAQDSGKMILDIYHHPSFDITNKTDHSPLTEADTASHQFICSELQKKYPSIPIISEEASEFHDFEVRKNWEYFFLVDPLDGTKEFIKRNGEFTINIALIKHSQPILGIIHAPALNLTYYAEKNAGAYKIENDVLTQLIPCAEKNQAIRVVISRSHACEKTNAYIEHLQNQGQQVVTKPSGSALKFGLVAEGKADVYPRFSPTMEWDTAAGHILVTEMGKQVLLCEKSEELRYNKIELRNPGFVVK